MLISNIDHFVITVDNIDTTCSFYEKILGFEILSFGDARKALKIGDQKMNLHQAGKELSPCAKQPTPGSADLCFITAKPLSSCMAHLNNNGVEIELGPVKRYGVNGKMDSIYFRDPDGNLLEVSYYN